MLEPPPRLILTLGLLSLAAGACNRADECEAIGSAGACMSLFWSVSVGGPSSQWPSAIATDEQRNIVTAGLFDGSIAPDGTHAVDSVSGADIYLMKHDPLGELVWSRTIPLTTPVPRVYLAADASGRIVIAGNFDHYIAFDGQHKLSSSDARDVFVAAYDADGRVEWARAFGGPGSQSLGGVALNALGELVIAGVFEQSIELNKVLETEATPQNFVAKLRVSDGRVLWSRTLGDAEEGYAPRPAIDIAGDVAVLGGSRAEWFVRKMNVAGDLLWSGTPGNDTSAGAATCSGVLLDYSGAPVSFIQSEDLLTITRRDARDGAVVWENGFNGGDMGWSSLALGEDGQLILGGAFWDTLRLDVGGSAVEFRSTGNQDILLATLDLATGQIESAAHYGGPGEQRITAITSDVTGSAIATGDFRLTLDFGDGPLTSRAVEDVFIAKF